MSERQFKRFTLVEENGASKLFLGDMPVTEGQVLLTKYGENEVLPARVSFSAERGWELCREEFIGMSYLDLPLSGEFIEGELKAVPEQPQ